MISFTLLPLSFQGKILWYSLDRRMSGTRAGFNAMEEKIFSWQGIKTCLTSP
jgi:hypothetical protein